jgi:preprotein translocase subunit SecD
MHRIWIFLGMAFALIATNIPRDFSIGGQFFKEIEIIDARALPDLNGSAAILITFSDKGAKRLTRISRKNRGKPVAVSLNDKILVRPVMHSVISDGVLQLNGLFTVTQATQIARQISGKDPLPETLDDGP